MNNSPHLAQTATVFNDVIVTAVLARMLMCNCYAHDNNGGTCVYDVPAELNMTLTVSDGMAGLRKI